MDDPDVVPAMVKQYDLTVERIHTHIGSGSDPEIWQQVATKSLSFCSLWNTVHTLNLGGGYKVGRNPGEPTTDLQMIGKPVTTAFEKFAQENEGRELNLEIEPGRYLYLINTHTDTHIYMTDTTHTQTHTYIYDRHNTH